MKTRAVTQDHIASRAARRRWVTRLSREGERRLYFYATAVLFIAWTASRLW